MTSILCLSCSKVSFVEAERKRAATYNLVNHHEYSRFGMLHAFYVTKDIHPISLVKAGFCSTAARETGRLWVCHLGAKQEDICSRISGYAIDMI